MPSLQPAEPVLSEVEGTPALLWGGFGCGWRLYCGLGRCCRFGCRWLRRRRSTFCDRDVINLHRAIRPVIGIAAHARDLFHQGNGSFVALAEDRVSAIQMRVGNFGDKELRAVRIRTGIGVSQSSGAVKLQGRRSFVLELETNVAASAARGVAALDHEIGNHAVEDGAVVEWDAMLLGMRNGISPVFGALS